MIVDLDECSEIRNAAACTSAECINTEGSFFCICNDGYVKANGSETACVDLDECAVGADSCLQLCSNTEGSYVCGCRDGYTLDTDGANCTINPTLGRQLLTGSRTCISLLYDEVAALLWQFFFYHRDPVRHIVL